MTGETLNKILEDLEGHDVVLRPRTEAALLRNIVGLQQCAPLSTLVRVIRDLKPR